MTDRSSCQQKGPGVMFFTGLITAAHVARFAQLRRARPRSATSSPYSLPKPHFLTPPGKNDPHIRVLAGFPGFTWDKLGGKNGLDSRAFSGLWVRCKSAVFWQTGRFLGVFSTRTEKEGFTGFSVFDRIIWMGNGARIGRISPNPDNRYCEVFQPLYHKYF